MKTQKSVLEEFDGLSVGNFDGLKRVALISFLEKLRNFLSDRESGKLQNKPSRTNHQILDHLLKLPPNKVAGQEALIAHVRDVAQRPPAAIFYSEDQATELLKDFVEGQEIYRDIFGSKLYDRIQARLEAESKGCVTPIAIEVAGSLKLRGRFSNGTESEWDLKSYLELEVENPDGPKGVRDLLDQSIFETARLSNDDLAIVWSNGIHLSAMEIFYEGTPKEREDLKT